MSKCHIFVGATDTGKSHQIKQLLKKVNKDALFIYDVNNEYREFFPYPFVDFDRFIEAATRLKNAVLVVEEATIFLNNRSSNEFLREILVRKKHTNVFIILVFHSVRAIPRYIYELSNYITIFNTNDSPDMSAKELKDERIEKIMLEVRNNTDKKFIHKKPDGTLVHFFNKTLKIY